MSGPSDDDAVGYGRPPRSGQFKPGQSGNPLGRPRKAAKAKQLLPTIQPTQTMLQAVAKHPVVVREADKRFEIATTEAVVRALAKTAMQGRVLAQRTWLEFQIEQDRIHEAHRRESFVFWQDYVDRKRAEIEKARRAGRPLPEPLPHPDDIRFDYADLAVRFVGPCNEREVEQCKREWQQASFLIELIVDQGLDIGQIQNSIRPEIDLLPLLFLCMINTIPKRFCVRTEEEQADMDARIRMTPARRLQALRERGCAVGLPIDPGRRFPRLDLRTCRMRIVNGRFEHCNWPKVTN